MRPCEQNACHLFDISHSHFTQPIFDTQINYISFAEVEDKIQMNMLLYDHHDDDFDIIRRKAAGLVLKSMEFEVEGL